MLAGTVIGVALYLHTGAGLPLLVAATVTVSTAVVFRLSGASRVLDRRSETMES